MDKIKLPGQLRRRARVMPLWTKIATDVMGGIPIPEVAKRYINPKTKKHYTPNYIYYIIKELNKSNE